MATEMLKHLSSGFVALAVATQAGCGKPQSIAVDSGKPAAASSNATGDEPTNNVKPEDVIGKDAKLLAATFDINVVALGLPMCKGDVDMQINAAMKKENSASLFDIPRGLVKCTLMGEIDLAQVLGGFAKPEDTVQDPMVVDNDVIHMKQVGLGKYKPARPMLPSFLASSKEDLASLDYTRTVTVTGADGKTASGEVQVRTISFGDSYSPPKLDRVFKNVLHFEVINKGFDGVDKVSNLLFDKMEFKISLNPVAVLQVKFKGKVADYMAAAQNNPGVAGGAGGIGSLFGGGGGLVGLLMKGLVKVIDVNMTMDLVKQDGLDKFEEEDEGDGEVIGGKKVED